MLRMGAGSARHVALVAVGLVLLLASSALLLAGRTPVPLVLVVAALVCAGLSRTIGWVLSLALGPVALLALLMVLGQVYPDVGVPFGAGNAVALVLVGLLGLAGCLVGSGPARPARDGVLLAGVAALVPVAAAGWLAAVRAASEGHKLAWIMNNDSAYSLFTSRWILLDGGVDPDKHPSPAVGASEIVAMFTAPGRGGVAADALLLHDLDRALQALVLATCALSFLGAVAVGLAVRRGHLLPRLLVAAAVAVVPWTWFMFGNATRLGFWNALFTSAVLGAAWLAFAEADRHPTAASAVQALAGTALLPLWAPTILVPGAFGVLIVARHWRSHVGLRGWRLVVWTVPLLVLAWYFLFVLRPLMADHGGALGADGAFFEITRTSVLVVLAVAAALGLLALTARGRGWEALGCLAVVLVGLVGLQYLISQRAETPSGPWGYYPQKFGWLMAYLAVLLSARAALVVALPGTDALASRGRSRALAQGLAAAVSPVVLVVVLLAQVPPADPRPLTSDHPAPEPTPHWALGSVLPIASVAQEDGVSTLDPALHRLFELSPPGEKHVLSRGHQNSAYDYLANFWLLSQPIVRDDKAVREFAYFLDPFDAASVCELAATWGPGVNLHTIDPAWGDAVRSTCPEAGLRIRTAGAGRRAR